MLSVIVPTYNRAAILPRLLDGLCRELTDPHEVEVIVVDDGSQDATSRLLADFEGGHSWLRPLRQANAGQATARRAGVAASCGEVLLFLDDDMEPTPGLLNAHRRFHADERAGRPASVALGAILPPPGDPRRSAFELFYERSIERLYSDFDSAVVHPSGRHLYTANCSLRRSLYETAGGFDHTFRHAEDRELGLRLEHSAGAAFTFLRTAAAYHHSQTQSYTAFVRRARLYGKYDLEIALKYPEHAELHPRTIFESRSAIKRRLAAAAWRSQAWIPAANRVWPWLAEAMLSMGSKRLAVEICSALYCINYVAGFRHTDHREGPRDP